MERDVESDRIRFNIPYQLRETRLRITLPWHPTSDPLAGADRYRTFLLIRTPTLGMIVKSNGMSNCRPNFPGGG
jgi:hypothetical protein